ncbi:glycoside hydrolase family 31 protein [Paenibacillus sp. D2_2]|uniref:TIM-barrel domain-containing protein n=1 Tax=Paenibacillus sp. D2_2 TaxID=3073092 RepID=UPI002814B74C|nr:TIM-barrel domain-containing protein [Paenibacillus sp. D2_2]WMT41904.1 glycoside hydrolase family 31 protein [Paenibacillus sp. D2_2]
MFHFNRYRKLIMAWICIVMLLFTSVVPVSHQASANSDPGAVEAAEIMEPVVNEGDGIITEALSEVPGELRAEDVSTASEQGSYMNGKAEILDKEIQVNLTDEGNVDWIRLGDEEKGIKARKNIGAEKIQFGVFNGGMNRFTDYIARFTWNDGKPTEKGDNEQYGTFVRDINGGWQLTVPVSAREMQFKVYAGAWASKGKIEAYFTDNSIPVFEDAYDTKGESPIRKVYTISFKGNGSKQSLIIKGTVEGKYHDWGNISLAAAGLSAPVSPSAPVWPQSSTLTATDITESSAVLSWNPAEDPKNEVEAYKIYQGNVEIASVTGAVYSYKVLGLEAGHTYQFNVEAANKTGELSINGPSLTVATTRFYSIGDIVSYKREGDNTILFDASPVQVRIKAVSPEVIKVWAEPTGKFDRKYESIAIVNDDLGGSLTLAEKGDYYEIRTSELLMKVFKAPLRLEYYDLEGNLLSKGKEGKSLGWNGKGEVGVWNEIQSDEHFWGLGEKTESFDRSGQKIYQWGVDLGGASWDSMAPSNGEGRWYGADPHFMSSKGYSIYFDNTSRTCFDMGKSEPGTYSFSSLDPAAGGELLYYFIYGPTPKQMISKLTDLTGKHFMPPMWAFGNMQSHWGYTQADIERVAEEYRKRQIPLDVMYSDIEWYAKYCTPTEWNNENFPDPAGMIKRLHDMGMKVSLIDDPNIIIFAKDYPLADQKGYFIQDSTGKTRNVSWPWGDESGVMDFFNPEVRKWWGDLHNYLADMGVNAFWTDMNEPARYSTDWRFWNEAGKEQGDIGEMHNAYATMHQKSIYEWYKEYTQKRPFILTRSFFTGSQRYAAPWSGDIESDWNSMSQQIRLGTGITLSGYNMWGFDIGGFSGNPTSDQFKRWIELAAFMPVHRFHYAKWGSPQEAWENGAENVARKYISQRQRLIPYFYSYMADSVIGTGMESEASSGSGLPLMRAMMLEYPNDNATYNMDSQFMNGQSFLIAPVTEDSTKKEVYFPAGDWYDYSDGKTLYEGNQTISYSAPLDKLPVFVKAGAIIPMTPAMQYIGEKKIDVMTMDIYPQRENGTSSFVLYEDDGESLGYEQGKYSTTKFENTVSLGTDGTTNTFKIHARQQGKGGFEPDARSYMLQFHQTIRNDMTVRQDGIVLPQYGSLNELEKAKSGWFTDKQSLVTYVKISDHAKETVIELSGETANENPFTVASSFNLNKLEAGKVLNADITVKNNGNYTETVLIVAALYDQAGKMINVSSVPVTIGEGATEVVTAGFKLPSQIQGHQVKIFIRDGDRLDAEPLKLLSNELAFQ